MKIKLSKLKIVLERAHLTAYHQCLQINHLKVAKTWTKIQIQTKQFKNYKLD
jgi:hypothetical protein